MIKNGLLFSNLHLEITKAAIDSALSIAAPSDISKSKSESGADKTPMERIKKMSKIHGENVDKAIFKQNLAFRMAISKDSQSLQDLLESPAGVRFRKTVIEEMQRIYIALRYYSLEQLINSHTKPILLRRPIGSNNSGFSEAQRKANAEAVFKENEKRIEGYLIKDTSDAIAKIVSQKRHGEMVLFTQNMGSIFNNVVGSPIFKAATDRALIDVLRLHVGHEGKSNLSAADVSTTGIVLPGLLSLFTGDPNMIVSGMTVTTALSTMIIANPKLASDNPVANKISGWANSLSVWMHTRKMLRDQRQNALSDELQ